MIIILRLLPLELKHPSLEEAFIKYTHVRLEIVKLKWGCLD